MKEINPKPNKKREHEALLFKLEPIAVIKMNKVEPLVIVDAKVFFKMMRDNG